MYIGADLKKYVVLHQVRHPLDNIASLHSIYHWPKYDKWCHYIDYHHDSLLMTCMKYWYHWNKRCEALALHTYKVENIKSSLPKNINTRPHLTLSWEQIKEESNEYFDRIVQLGNHYGYKI